MKTINLKSILAVTVSMLLVACGTGYKGSASDTTGTNGATNGNGKVMNTGVHSYNTK